MRRHRTKQPIGPATAPSMAAPATARQKSSSMMVMPMMVVLVMVVVRRLGVEDRARSAVGVIVAVGIERDLIGHTRAEQSDESGIAHHGGRIAFAANMAGGGGEKKRGPPPRRG